jgi:3-hydroxypropanoate dehydrogenase
MIDEAARARLFTDARTAIAWADRPVPDARLVELYDLLKWAPTSGNCSPARFVFLRTVEAKQRLAPALSAGNVARALAAPVVAIVAQEPQFFHHLPRLYPQADVRDVFAANPALAEDTGRRNTTLQGAYLILAARAVGLDCAPMSGFDNAMVDRLFLDDTGWRSDFLVALGHADPAAPVPRRNPRLAFDEACRLA